MTRTILLLGAALLAACGGNGSKLTAEEARNALPGPENAQVGTPPPGGAAAKAAVEAAVASNSDFYWLTGALAASVNGGVGGLLLTVRFVVMLPPTSCQDDTCTWGPWDDANPLAPNVWKLTVTKNGDQYDWALSGQPKTNPSAGFFQVIYGSAIPGSAPLRGHGTVTVDFEAMKNLDGIHEDDGQINCQYDARGPLHLACEFLGMLDRDPTAAAGAHVNAAYEFQASTSGGDLQVAWRTLPPTTAATLSLHSRWDSTGAGRGDLELQAGATYQESECWDTGAAGFALLYDTNPPYGDEAFCAFIPASYATLAAP